MSLSIFIYFSSAAGSYKLKHYATLTYAFCLLLLTKWFLNILFFVTSLRFACGYKHRTVDGGKFNKYLRRLWGGCEILCISSMTICCVSVCPLAYLNKKLSYRPGTARCVVSIEILPIATQQCRNYLYDKSWPNRCYEVGDLVGGNAW